MLRYKPYQGQRACRAFQPSAGARRNARIGRNFTAICVMEGMYCTVLYSTELYITVLYSIAQYRIVHYSIVQYCTVPYCTLLYSTVLKILY